MGDLPLNVGYLTVTAKGLVGLADSTDATNQPDALAMSADVTFAPSIDVPLTVTTTQEIVTLATIQCILGSDGTLRPPSSGQEPPIDASGTLRLVAPNQSGINITGWTWTASFRPTGGQSWRPFSITFSGNAGDTINLGTALAEQPPPNLPGIPSLVTGAHFEGADLFLDRANGSEIAVGASALGYFTPEKYGAFGDNVADDTSAIQSAINAAAAAGGGVVFLSSTSNYLTTATLNVTASNVIIAAARPGCGIRYTGSDWAIRFGSPTGSAYIFTGGLRDLTITGTASGLGGVQVVNAQRHTFFGITVTGFTAGTGLEFTTQSDANGNRAASHNRVYHAFFTSVLNGVKITKDAGDSGTDGANLNHLYSVTVTNFTGIGIDNDMGEGTRMFGCDVTSSVDATTGIRINDDVVALYSCRFDGSQGAGNLASVGLLIEPAGLDFVVELPIGNGNAEQIKFTDPAAARGRIIRQGYTTEIGSRRLSIAATGQNYWTARAYLNAGATIIAPGEVCSLDPTLNEGEVKRVTTAAAPTAPRPMVAVESIAAGVTGGVAEPGSLLSVSVDTGAVAIGDTIVASTNTAGRAMVNNAVTDPRFIIGTARSAKAAGANGSVRVLIA